MTRKKSAEQQPAEARTESAKDPVQERAERRDWADEAAQARTADDPRTVVPRDSSGAPSQGEPL
jgi:hypothetical protein